MKLFLVYLTSILLLSAGCQRGARVADSRSGLPVVDHILLEVTNLDQSVRFYHDELGLQVKSRSGDFAVLEAANIGIYLWSKHWEWSPPPTGIRPPQGMYPHLIASDVKGLVERLRRDGYRIVAEPKHHIYGTEAFIADPDGYVWALISR